MSAPLTSPGPQLLIGGELRGASDGAEFPIVNPADGEVIGTAPDATDADVEAAVLAARRAFDSTGWAGDPAFRAHCLGQLQAALNRGFAALQEITIAEAGAPRM